MNARTRRTHAAVCALVLAAASPAMVLSAEEESDDGRAAVVPPLPEATQREAYGQTITEYRRGNEIFLITVKPRYGPTQYWSDPDGDGQFQRSTSDDVSDDINLPKWRLGSW